MIREVCGRLLDNKMSEPSTPEEAQVWVEAAMFLSGRIQGSPDEKPGRAVDMSSAAAKALRTVLADMEAGK